MDKSEHRVQKLRALVERHGGLAEFVKARTQPDADKGINATYVSQLLQGHRTFGERAAANMEKRAGLPRGYFDSEDDASQASASLSHRQRALLGLFESLTASQQDALIRELEETKQQNDLLLSELMKRRTG